MKLEPSTHFIRSVYGSGLISPSPSVSTNLGSVVEEEFSVVDHGTSVEKEERTLFNIKRDFIDLTLRANGKADLYFHAYFWYRFAMNLYLRENTTGN